MRSPEIEKEDVDVVALLGRPDAWMPPQKNDAASNVSTCIQRARSVARSDPEMSVNLTTIATSLADHLDSNASNICLLRSNAWREHAESLAFVGRNAEAFAAIERAEAELTNGGCPDFDRARLVLTRANVLHQAHRGLEAIFQVREAAQVFLRIGALRQFVNARLIESTILYLAGRPADALAAWQDLDRDMDGCCSDDAEVSAMMFHTIAMCFRGQGDLAGARTYFERAKANFVAIGSTADATKVDWSVAKILLAEGRLEEAVVDLTAIGSTFGQLSMRVEEALTGLDRVDALLALGRASEARKICPPIIKAFESAGMNREMARALTHLHDALRTSRRRGRESQIRKFTIPHVRTFIEKQAKSGSATARFEPPLS